MAIGDGDGWRQGHDGRRHWGLNGAAGLVLLRTLPQPAVLLQLRAAWTHQGGSWGVVGGARDSHESVAEAALREAGEEAGVDPALVTVIGSRVGADEGTWSYTYVLALTGPDLEVRATSDESDELRWIGLDDVAALPLHPGLAAAWPGLRRQIEPALIGPYRSAGAPLPGG